MTAGVYLIHFETPYKHARHYVGWSGDVESRLQRHREGNGARLMEVVTDAGIAWQVAWVWPEADRAFERNLKDQKNTARFCPICRHSIQMSLWELLDTTSPSVEIDWDAIEEIEFVEA
ncbi:MAG: endonuclease [Anaerolineae bacterium]|nr:endonuclease [Anaerolineae bacterium]